MIRRALARLLFGTRRHTHARGVHRKGVRRADPHRHPLAPADRMALAPTHWLSDRRQLSAGEHERTARISADTIRRVLDDATDPDQ